VSAEWGTDHRFGMAEAKLAAIKPKQSTLAGISILLKRGATPQAGATSGSSDIVEAFSSCFS
jgi:hypothetical protein